MANTVMIDCGAHRVCVIHHERGEWNLVLADCVHCGQRLSRFEYRPSAIEDMIAGREYLAYRVMADCALVECRREFSGAATWEAD
jgi:hypothetical protein